MRTYQKLRIESRMRSGLGLSITAKPHGDVVSHVAKESDSATRRNKKPVNAATTGTTKQGCGAAQHPYDASDRPDRNQPDDTPHTSTKASPRFGEPFAREQTASPAEIRDA